MILGNEGGWLGALVDEPASNEQCGQATSQNPVPAGSAIRRKSRHRFMRDNDGAGRHRILFSWRLLPDLSNEAVTALGKRIDVTRRSGLVPQERTEVS